MNINEALNILKLKEANINLLKKAYKLQANKYHPDKGGSNEMMQVITEAYTFLKKILNDGSTVNKTDESTANISEDLNAAINAVINLQGIIVEVAGTWVWLTGETYEHKEAIKKAGFKYSRKKTAWYFHTGDYKRKTRKTFSMDEVRTMHNSKIIQSKQSFLAA